MQLQNVREKVLEGVMLRSKCRYENLGEKPTNYFFNLEKRNYINKTITKLINENDKEYKTVNEILHYQRKYYANFTTKVLT